MKLPSLCALAPLLFLPPALGAESQIIADFEGADYAGWVATGTAFGDGPAHGALPEQSPVGGYRGMGYVNSYHGTDKAIGTLTSPEFKLSLRYLSFLIGGGEEVGKTCVNVVVDGKVVRSATGREDEFLTTATFDLQEFAGKAAQIQIVDAATGGWGHVNADHFILTDTAPTPPYVQNPAPAAEYEEALRPQFHFTAKQGWLNDPNGLVYSEGEYHLFFQHNPEGREWGNMTWGHSVSDDLVHWRQLDHALYPDKLGTMFSGSAVVDRDNTAGFKTGTEPPLVAIYTAAGGTSEESKGQLFTQCIAYSNDKGRSWTKYAGNPVLKNIGEGDRDPKVFWHAPTKRWVMPLYVGERDASKPDKNGKPSVRNVCHFYTSPDLKNWTFASKFAEELFECPGFVELPVDGDAKNTRWALWGASGEYWLGRFDGREFTAETPRIKADFGANSYAAQAYDDLPDHRTVFITWMQGGKYPKMPFNQQMGFPLELTLQTTPDGIRIVRWPVSEIRNLFVSSLREDLPRPLTTGRHELKSAAVELLDLELEFLPGTAQSVTLELRGQKLVWNAKAGELTALGRTVPLKPAAKTAGRHSDFGKPWGPDFEPWNDSVRLRVLLDRSSLELYGNGGTTMASFCFIPHEGPSAALIVDGGEVPKARVTVRELKSAWRP
ncbi:MAG TPA: glycoside hydrolase family 32 protein [Candidatus Limnocylindria bacterium]|nr:glycoside hydrolase family 32 protein [Candidatus Limnocylindria bacterium]